MQVYLTGSFGLDEEFRLGDTYMFLFEQPIMQLMKYMENLNKQ